MVPRTVLTRSSLISINTARPVNTVQPRTTLNNEGLMKNVNTVKGTRVNTARPKVVLGAVKGNKGNAVKASACWVLRPKHKVLDHGNTQQDLKDKGVIDSRCSRHMIGNRSYLIDYEEIDRGFVSFGGNSKGGKITRKGKIRTGKLDFEDVYFVKELKFNLFNFKLTNESHVLLKVPRKDNMYNVDLKNVIPQGGLTCLFAKSTPVESNLGIGETWTLWPANPLFSQDSKSSLDVGFKPSREEEKKDAKDPGNESGNLTDSQYHRSLRQFSENTPNIAGSRPNWLFDIDALTKSMNYKPVIAGNHSNGNARTKACDDTSKARMETDSPDTGFKPLGEEEKKDVEDLGKDSEIPSIEEPKINQEKDARVNSTNNINTVSPTVNAASKEDNVVDENIVYACADDPNIPELGQIINLSGDDEVVVQGQTMDKGDILLVQVYVDDIIFGSTKKSSCIEFEKMMHKKFQISSMGELTFFLGLQVKQKEDGIFLCQVKYVTEILKKFGFSDVKIASTPMKTHKPLLKDADGEDVDEHLYRSMIGSLMYLTSSRPDIMFAVCACARFQVNPKISHLHAVKRIFRYLKGQPKLGLWYPKDSPFDLVAFTDSDYAGASLDRKSTTGGCQFLGCRLISWQCKKQTVVANSTTKAEYIAASNCCGQVLWIQNQLLDYGYNFMHTKIYIDNERTICIVKNPIFYSKTKHIGIRHHFIRDSNEKKLIQMIKIHTDQNVVDLLTKAFDRIIHKGWLKWNVTAARDEIEVKTGNSRVSTTGQKLNFADSHNMVAYLETSTENADFAEIVNFLNANLISMMRNLDSSKKFLMYPRFLQLFLNKQIENHLEVNVVYDTPSHTKKIFANMRRQGKDFSRTVTLLFSSMLTQQADMGEGSGQPTDPQYTSTSVQTFNKEPITIPLSSQPKKTHKPRKAKRATEIYQCSRPISLVADETVTKEREDRMEKSVTTASSLEAEQDSGNINRTQSISTLNEPNPQGTSSSSGLRCQDTILGDAEAQTRFETTSKQSNDPPLSRVNTLRSREDRLKLKELMDICTRLSDRVLDLETTKTAQAKEIASLKKRVKRWKGKGNIDEVFKDVEGDAEHVISVVVDEVSTGTKVDTASAPVTTVGVYVSTAEPITTTTLMKMRSEKSKVRGVVMQEPSETATRPTVPPQQHDLKDKGKDYEIAARIQAQEQKESTIKEKSRLFVELMDKRKKHFARLRIEEQRRKPLTKAQKRNQMCTYMKNMAGFTHNQLKNKNRAEGSETRAEGSSKKVGEDLQQESTKKQKMEDDKEKE
ncbi:putative ribonuclease H-like domain-containing protein [Tanacetum coccineum]